MTKPYEPPSRGGWLGFIGGFLVLWGVLHITAGLDPSARWGLGVLAAVLVSAVAVESVLGRGRRTDALTRIGLARPAARALLVAGVVSVLILLVFPAWAMATGSTLRLRPGWMLSLIHI